MIILFKVSIAVLSCSSLMWQIVELTTGNGGNVGSLVLFGIATSMAISQLLKTDRKSE